MIQHHLNAGRRKGLSAPSIWPEGANGVGDCNSAKKDTTFRGGGIPEAHVHFYKALAGTGRIYRIPGLLATSFKTSVAIGFMSRAKDDPKVLWTIKLKDREELGGGCNQVSFLEKTAYTQEKEFLFSTYSCFRVLECTLSDNPYDEDTPHQITIEACKDNSKEPENVPSAPWY